MALNLDADEVLSNELVYEIKAHLAAGNSLPCSIKVTTVYPYQDKPRLWADYNSVVWLYNKTKMRFRNHPTWDAVELPYPTHFEIGLSFAVLLGYYVVDPQALNGEYFVNGKI